jgi:hypothetical protein
MFCAAVGNRDVSPDAAVVRPVRHGDVIQLIHGMTGRPLNR